MSEQLDLLATAAPAKPTAPAKLWSKDGGGFIYRTETQFGRIWPSRDEVRWWANRRPEPYNPKNPCWEGSFLFSDRAAAEAWVEGRGGVTP